MSLRLVIGLTLLATGGSAAAQGGRVNTINEQVRYERQDKTAIYRDRLRRAEQARERSAAAARKRAAEAERETSQTPQQARQR
ncbi:hypothetical protein [Glacieibacterium frigidum]|uniref:Uncharacterized protein n=1 Tax=Glacieibacterium frigidum TaxID=2593303 RepID=A0A552U7H8_9SPHN|nr:hypothetical protein [Glacieibacterium frigidum]TRW14172.1 hypothetical protein FMM06_10635 [Glacieibacterium frigidum]